MIRLETYEPAPDPWGGPSTTWWKNVRRAIPGWGKHQGTDELDEFAQQWSGQWEYGWSAPGSRSLFPKALVFEHECDAAMFILRWS